MMCEALTSNHLHTRYTGSFYIFSYKTFSEGYKQLYDRSMKGILSEPTRRFPHTKVIYHPSITCYRGNKTLNTRLYMARLTRQKKVKDFKDMQGVGSLVGLEGGWIGLSKQTLKLLSNSPYDTAALEGGTAGPEQRHCHTYRQLRITVQKPWTKT